MSNLLRTHPKLSAAAYETIVNKAKHDGTDPAKNNAEHNAVDPNSQRPQRGEREQLDPSMSGRPIFRQDERGHEANDEQDNERC
jgi:hypothetical protein